VQPPKTQYARNGDVNLAYQVVGDGSIDLAIVPGFISHVDLWWTIPQHPALSQPAPGPRDDVAPNAALRQRGDLGDRVRRSSSSRRRAPPSRSGPARRV